MPQVQTVRGAVERLAALAATGVRTIVDPTVVGLGRYIPRIQQVGEQVDVDIVVATGCYPDEDAPVSFRPSRGGTSGTSARTDRPGRPGDALIAAAGTPGSGGQRTAGISLVVVDNGDHASGWGRPASRTHDGAAAAESARRAVSGRALRRTMSASRTSSPTRTAPMTRNVESMC